MTDVVQRPRGEGFHLRNGALARLAVPDTDGVTLDRGLSAEGADVTGVLGDFHLLDGLSEGGTVSLILMSACRHHGMSTTSRGAVVRSQQSPSTNVTLLTGNPGIRTRRMRARWRLWSRARSAGLLGSRRLVSEATGWSGDIYEERLSCSYLVPYLPVTASCLSVFHSVFTQGFPKTQ